MEVISSFISMVLDISSSKMQGSKPDMPINKEHAVFLDLHNKTRDIYNLGPLEEDRGCLLVAQSHATWMARSSTLGHLGFSFFGPPQRLAVIGKEPSRIGECISFSRSTSSSEGSLALGRQRGRRSIGRLARRTGWKKTRRTMMHLMTWRSQIRPSGLSTHAGSPWTWE